MEERERAKRTQKFCEAKAFGKNLCEAKSRTKRVPRLAPLCERVQHKSCLFYNCVVCVVGLTWLKFMENLLAIINTILENRGRAQIDCISADTDLRRDLGFDSFDLAEFTVRIEAEYDVDVFEDGIVYTIGDILEKID